MTDVLRFAEITAGVLRGPTFQLAQKRPRLTMVGIFPRPINAGYKVFNAVLAQAPAQRLAHDGKNVSLSDISDG